MHACMHGPVCLAVTPSTRVLAVSASADLNPISVHIDRESLTALNTTDDPDLDLPTAP